MKQTAVEYLAEQLDLGLSENGLKSVIQQAKEMEKQQIVDAYTNEDNIQWDKQLRTRAAEQYYNETFKSK
jgi:vacuolar-type H+-ATPase subunit H